MFKKKHLILVVILITVALFSCTSKKYSKLALKNEQAGLFEDAAELYLISLAANKKNIDAKIGARKNGQIAIDKKLAAFTKAYSSGQNNIAVYNFLDAKKYLDRFATNGIELDMALQYKEQFNEAKKIYIEEKYKEAILLLNNEKFFESSTILIEINSLENTYKDTKELLITAHNEPLYRKGKAYLDNKYYRKAYYVFSEIIKGVGNYKESTQYKQDALNGAQFAIWVKDIENINDQIFAAKLKSNIVNELINAANPFIKVIENPNILGSENKALLNTSIFDKVTSNLNAQKVDLKGIKAILVTKIEKIVKVTGNLTSNSGRGFNKTTKTNANGQKIDEFNKVEYKEFFQTNYTKCFFKLQLISTENNEVLASDASNFQTADELHFATYDGNYSNLIPGYWKDANSPSGEDKVKNNYNEIQNLQNLFKAKRNIKSTEVLLNELISEITLKTRTRIINYNPEN
jgi:hypothetical protein